eukprot:scaffold11145_cov104-Skeletonema_marinoi.AAC.2
MKKVESTDPVATAKLGRMHGKRGRLGCCCFYDSSNSTQRRLITHPVEKTSFIVTKPHEYSEAEKHEQAQSLPAAESSRNINRESANIAQLRVSNMKLHGRDDHMKLIRSKLRELAKAKDVDEDEEDAAKYHVGEMILVSGTSGTGKSTLIRKGLGDHAAKCGCIFASGKLEDKLHSPLSAFSDAILPSMYIAVEHNKMGELSSGRLSISTMIRKESLNEFDNEDVEQLRRVLPGCAELLGTRRHSLVCPPSKADAAPLVRSGSGSKLGDVKRRMSLTLAGKESIAQMHYAVRRFLKIVCSQLKGVVLFIDDLQWSDTETLDLLKSIVLDEEIPSLLIVGAYREDEVPE